MATALTPTGGPPVSLSSRAMHTEAAQRLVKALREAALQSRHIRADELSSADGAALSALLGPALADLARFRRQLVRPGRRPKKAKPASTRTT